MAPELKKNRPLLIMPTDHTGTNFRHLTADKFWPLLEQNLNVIDVTDSLLENHLLSESQVCEILKQNSYSDQVRLLLDYVNNSSRPGLIPAFVGCLKSCGYLHAAKLINDYLDNLYKSAWNNDRVIGLKCGLVPQQPDIFVEREFVYKLKEELTKACWGKKNAMLDPTNWILVHGMPGNGKTYLTAAAVRAPEIWSVCFPSGVYWLDIGKPGTDKLMIKLGALLQMLEDRGPEGTPVAPTDIDNVIPRLAKIFATEKPESAIVLDDVWDESVIKCFAKVPCKCIIVTSRRADITRSVVNSVSKLDVVSGFTADESKEYFSQILKKKKEDLPTEAQEIHEQCTGSPMLLSLIGGLLRDNPLRWKHYLHKLQDHSLKDHKNIDEAIKLSVDELKDDLREKFFDFAVFDDDVPIPIPVFGTLWNIEILEEVEDLMAYFVNSSLVIKEYCDQRKCVLYRFHDLILHYARSHVPVKGDILVKEARQTALVDKHRKLFYKYKNLCRGTFGHLEDDYYFHAFVGYHMSQGKLFADIQEVYRDRTFLEQRLEYCGPEVVLVDVILLKRHHPFLNDLMISIENSIRSRFTICSPDVKLNKRRPSSVYSRTDLSIVGRSNRNSYIDISSSVASTPDNERRLRSSSDGNTAIHEVHSEPAFRGFFGITETTNGHGDEAEHLHREQSAPAILIVPVSMMSIRNDHFEDY